ncbi:MAG: (d)CMP kinase [Candidatus Hydrogenedentes bacterium]|nr:(d)CMP kinase [Candidatus Hydrogenedentota bacterium]
MAGRTLGKDSMFPGDVTEIVAIDGPAGAGKSTVARNVARQLGFAYLDTGAMYRAATWNAMNKGVDADDPLALAASTREMRLDLRDENGTLHIFIDGQEVTDAIRTPEVTRRIAKLDRNAGVRAHLAELQREIGARAPTVAEGRDMGTVVFPRAKCKVYLDANLDERARRRARDFDAKGIAYDAASLKEEIRARDENDRSRDIAPLRRAEDAVLVDTSSMSADDVVNTIVEFARTRW